MSNSAFTPSTTTVTNNVPVNVPVVTAWEDVSSPAIPTGLGSGSGTWSYYKTRRVGGNLEIMARFNKDATAGTGSANVSYSLPQSGISIDSSINTAGYALSYLVGGQAGYRVIGLSRFSSTSFGFDKDGGADAVKGSDMAANSQIRFVAIIPIAEWAGSGTTTLATRAVEEYAYNTNTSNTSNTSAFANGPDGVLFPQITTFGVSVNKRVRFQTSILPTDAIILEYQQAGSGSWRTMSQRLPIIQQGANGYGVDIVNVSGSTTDIDIGFREGGAVTNGATYGANGEAWNAYYLAGWKWRVRKVSGGAQVGYPVSARNIVGDTSGSVVPVGMLGETTTIATASGVNIGSGSNVFITGLTQTLSAGTWMLIADGTVSVTTPASGMTSGQNAYMDLRIQNTTDATTAASISSVSFVQALSATTVCGGAGSFSLTAVLNLTSQKTFQVQGTYQSNIAGGSTQIVRSGRFYAVRIA